MKRLLTLAVLAVVTAPVSAPFPGILPPEKGNQTVRVFFGDSVQPDKPELLKKIAHTELFVADQDGNKTLVKLAKNGAALEGSLPQGKGIRLLAGVCRYGVVQRGQSEP